MGLVDKAKILLEKDWPTEQLQLIKRLVDNLMTYKAFIPNTLKGDIIAMLDIASNIKDEYDILKTRETDLIKECIYDRNKLVEISSQTEDFHDNKCKSYQREDFHDNKHNVHEPGSPVDKDLPQPFSLVVTETGTIIFTIKSKSDHQRDEIELKKEDKAKEDKEDKNKDKEKTIEDILNNKEIEIIDNENYKYNDILNKNLKDEKKKKNKWRTFFCL
jgi:hypothetical protein